MSSFRIDNYNQLEINVIKFIFMSMLNVLNRNVYLITKMYNNLILILLTFFFIQNRILVYCVNYKNNKIICVFL